MALSMLYALAVIAALLALLRAMLLPFIPVLNDLFFQLGLALFELGQMKEGCAALVALPAKYPDAAPTVATRARTERTNNKCR